MDSVHTETRPPITRTAKAVRWAELLAVFFVLPALFAWWRATGSTFQDWLTEVGAPDALASAARPQQIMFPTLFLITACCLFALLLDKSFDKRRFGNARAVGPQLRRVLGQWAIGIAGITAFTAIVHPDWLFILPRSIPVLWIAIMCLYPIFSVYPQGIVYRLFFFHRYGPLLRSVPAMVLLNALAFGWMHIVFLNWIAPAMTFAGGVLFAVTYLRSRSALAAGLEHALYGCWIFTVGLGLYFFGGAQIDENGKIVPPDRGDRQQQSDQPPAD